ncbi:MAG: DUF2236 domain-containing protein [Ignavibacteriales bacterium]|nr:DUF2236 domain-containing protein [Ignavibacteriales bacterium]
MQHQGNRWNNAFLDSLRRQGDPLADEAFRILLQDGEAGKAKKLFAEMDANDEIPPATMFPELHEFFSTTERLPANVDLDRIRRGEDVFTRHPFTGALVLLAKSLPEGYAAPNLAIILNMSGNLRVHPYKRLLATLQTVVNVSTIRGFQDGGRAVITAQKLRLLHAGIRHITGRYRPEFESSYGVSANQEDMLGTIMGFSYLVIEGMRTLGVGLTDREEEDFLYVWRVFAHMMGIHPIGKPESMEFLPDSVEDAARFYEAYRRRHYVRAEQNPDGVALGAANLRMLKDFIPRFLKLFGLGLLPRLYMQKLMGEVQCRRINIQPVRGHHLLRLLLLLVHRLLRPLGMIGESLHEHFGMTLFQKLIDRSYGGDVTFTIPTDLGDLRKMIADPSPSSPHQQNR